MGPPVTDQEIDSACDILVTKFENESETQSVVSFPFQLGHVILTIMLHKGRRNQIGTNMPLIDTLRLYRQHLKLYIVGC